ncbi:MAG TPA: hypothetical protein VMS98_20530 [Thermoanaerobaculia bacterium]|nr:hypothetical protein [Thermoanaerobaculia bacterium]
MDSELLVVGDAGMTEATRPSRRRGVEVAAQYFLTQQLGLDAEYAFSRARFADHDPAGDRIPGAVEGVATVALSLDLRPATVEIRFRYVGPRPLIENDSARSSSSRLVSASASRQLSRNVQLYFDVFNLLDAEVSDIEYFYPSRLAGEPKEGIEGVHFRPVEPRSIRVGLRTTF